MLMPTAVAALALLPAAAAAYVVTVPAGGGDGSSPSYSMRVTATVGSETAFRLTVEFADGGSPDNSSFQSIPSPSLDPSRAMANFTRVSPSSPEGGGIQTAFGQLLISADGRFTLKDAAGKTVAAATAAPTLATEASSGHRPAITMRVSGSKTGPGATGRRPCLVK
eukprot:COSAG01_NODE_8001_length_2958_cov_1.785939_1_plen_166_part_00